MLDQCIPHKGGLTKVREKRGIQKIESSNSRRKLLVREATGASVGPLWTGLIVAERTERNSRHIRLGIRKPRLPVLHHNGRSPCVHVHVCCAVLCGLCLSFLVYCCVVVICCAIVICSAVVKCCSCCSNCQSRRCCHQHCRCVLSL